MREWKLKWGVMLVVSEFAAAVAAVGYNIGPYRSFGVQRIDKAVVVAEALIQQQYPALAFGNCEVPRQRLLPANTSDREIALASSRLQTARANTSCSITAFDLMRNGA